MNITIRRVEFIGNPGYLCTCGIEFEEESIDFPDEYAPIKCKNCGGYVTVKQDKEKKLCASKCNFPFNELKDYK